PQPGLDPARRDHRRRHRAGHRTGEGPGYGQGPYLWRGQRRGVSPRLLPRWGRDRNRPSPLAPPGGDARRGLRARLDRLGDALSPGALRLRFQGYQRRLGLTRLGVVAIVGFVGIWLLARIVAGTAMYLFAYGALLLVVISYLIAPRRLKLTGD